MEASGQSWATTSPGRPPPDPISRMLWTLLRERITSTKTRALEISMVRSVLPITPPSFASCRTPTRYVSALMDSVAPHGHKFNSVRQLLDDSGLHLVTPSLRPLQWTTHHESPCGRVMPLVQLRAPFRTG